MRVPAEDVAAMTNPPVARPEMTPPPTAPDQIAMIKIATYSRGPSSFKASSFKAMLDKPICAYIIGGNCLKPAQKGYTLVLSTGPSSGRGTGKGLQPGVLYLCRMLLQVHVWSAGTHRAIH